MNITIAKRANGGKQGAVQKLLFRVLLTMSLRIPPWRKAKVLAWREVNRMKVIIPKVATILPIFSSLESDLTLLSLQTDSDRDNASFHSESSGDEAYDEIIVEVTFIH